MPQDSTGSDIDRSSAARALQDGRHHQLEGLLGRVRAGRPRRPAGSARDEPATHRSRVHDAPLQEQVGGRRQRWTSHEEDHPRSQSTETSTLLHPALTTPRRRTDGRADYFLVKLLDPGRGGSIEFRGEGRG